MRLKGTVIASVLIATVGCGHDSSKPTDAQLARAFSGRHSPVGMPLPRKQADCVAHVYGESDLSSDYLKALARGMQPRPTEEDREALSDVQAAIAKDCLGA